MKIINTGIKDVIAGENVTVIMPANIYGCVLHDDVFVGPFVEIQSGCEIGSRCRIQSHTFICGDVTMGEDCFIGHNVTFANDLFKTGGPDPEPAHWIRIRLGDNVTIGSGSTILTTSICSGAVIGAGSVVVKPITEKGIYVGNPARLVRSL